MTTAVEVVPAKTATKPKTKAKSKSKTKSKAKQPAKKTAKKPLTEKQKASLKKFKSGSEHHAYNRTKESGGLLTERQTQILRLVVLGCSVREIATLTELAVSTVDNHKAAMMGILECHKIQLLVLRAIEMKIIKPTDTLTPAEMKKLGGDWKDGWNRR
jgi:DNA-binding NarL/FixJ family response regulator